jgi:hypothetical protein
MYFACWSIKNVYDSPKTNSPLKILTMGLNLVLTLIYFGLFSLSNLPIWSKYDWANIVSVNTRQDECVPHVGTARMYWPGGGVYWSTRAGKNNDTKWHTSIYTIKDLSHFVGWLLPTHAAVSSTWRKPSTCCKSLTNFIKFKWGVT